jgi:hypothetical protein
MSASSEVQDAQSLMSLMHNCSAIIAGYPLLEKSSNPHDNFILVLNETVNYGLKLLQSGEHIAALDLTGIIKLMYRSEEPSHRTTVESGLLEICQGLMTTLPQQKKQFFKSLK